MASLGGFRPPQFSEESAWLPIWLQEQNGLAFDHSNQGEASVAQHVEELQFLRHEIGKEEMANTSLRSEGGYKTCHLLLSGDEGSTLSFVPSTDNVVHFNLHLSSNCSESMPSLFRETSEIHRHSSNCLKHPLDSSVVSEENTNQSNVGYRALLMNCSSNVRSCNENELLTHKDHGCSPVGDVNEAVELSIAASEALMIHDILTDLKSKPCPIQRVLEVAIQVKHARLDVWKENSQCPILDSEIDFLSDLDDSIMEDAYENVGITSVDPTDLRCDSIDVSQVKDTLASENGKSRGNFIYEDTGINEIGIGRPLINSRSQIVEGVENGMEVKDDFTSKLSSSQRQKEYLANSSMHLDSVFFDSCNISAVHCSVQENCQVSSLLKVVKNAVKKEDSFEALAKSFSARTSEVSEKNDKILNVIPGGFQSRWFGGWTWKKEEQPRTPMENEDVQEVFTAFVDETSFLSESADVAPSENSAVQGHIKGSLIISQTSISSGFYCNKLDKEVLLSQDVMRCSSLAVSDPLGSAVPCSISYEISCSPANLHGGSNMLTTTRYRETSEDATKNKKQRTISMVEMDHGGNSAPVSYSGELQPAVHGQMMSQRSCSFMFAKPQISYVKESSSNRFFRLESKPKSSTMMMTISSNLTNKRNCGESMENSTATMILDLKERKPTPTLDLVEEKSALHGCHGELLNGKSHLKVQSNNRCQNASKVQPRKRVHFVTPERKNFQQKQPPKQQTSLKYCYVSGGSKRFRCTNGPIESGAQELKGCPRYVKKNMQLLKLFQNMEFLLTGLSNRKEKKYESLIRKYGGIVLSDIPPIDLSEKRISSLRPHMLPIVLSPKKLQTSKFLYGCAVNASVLKIDWVIDSIKAGSILPLEQYSILPRKVGSHTGIQKSFRGKGRKPIFGSVGIMLHGKSNFCNEMEKIIKHGGGLVCRTLKCLVDNLNAKRISVGAIVTENENRTSRHLKHCALEQNIPTVSTYWMVKSLHMGKVLPLKEKKISAPLPSIKHLDIVARMDLSEEI